MEDWLQRFKEDPVILGYMNKLAKIDEEVFDLENPKLDHLVCENIPEGLTEEMYIKIFRKEMTVMRYHVY